MSIRSLLFRCVALGAAAGLLLPSRPAAAQAWKDSLRAGVTQAIRLTRTTRDYRNVTTPGTLLAAGVPGLDVSPEAFRNSVATKLRDGAVLSPRGLSRFLAREHHRDLRKGEQVYVTDVKIRDDAGTLYIAAAETERITIRGTSRDLRYMGVLDFEFDKQSLPALGADSVVRAITATLRPTEAAATAASVPDTTRRTTQVSLAIGQSVEDVERALGKPENVIQLGNKTVYVYKAFKVTLVDGKVTDLQ
jgi:hypothetical protein